MVSDGQDVAFDNVAVTVVVAIPDIYVSPTSLNFGTVSVGSSVTKYLSVKNEGDGSLNISYSLNNPSLPVVLADNCGGSLSAGASCNISVTYIPTSAGALSGSLYINSNDPDEARVEVILSGNATLNQPDLTGQWTLMIVAPTPDGTQWFVNGNLQVTGLYHNIVNLKNIITS